MQSYINTVRGNTVKHFQCFFEVIKYCDVLHCIALLSTHFYQYVPNYLSFGEFSQLD